MEILEGERVKRQVRRRPLAALGVSGGEVAAITMQENPLQALNEAVADAVASLREKEILVGEAAESEPLPRLRQFGEAVTNHIRTLYEGISTIVRTISVHYSERTRQICQRTEGLEGRLNKTREAIQRVLAVPEAASIAIGSYFEARRITYTARLMSQHDNMSAALSVSFWNNWLVACEIRMGKTHAEALAIELEDGQTIGQRIVTLSERIAIARESQAELERAKTTTVVIIDERIASDPANLEKEVTFALNHNKAINVRAQSQEQLAVINETIDAIYQRQGAEEVMRVSGEDLSPWLLHQAVLESSQESLEIAEHIDAIFSAGLKAVRPAFREIGRTIRSIRNMEQLSMEERIHLISEIAQLLGFPQERIADFVETIRLIQNGEIEPSEDILAGYVASTIGVSYMLDQIAPRTGRRFAQLVARATGGTQADVRRYLRLFEDNGVIGATRCRLYSWGSGFADSFLSKYEWFSEDFLGKPSLTNRPDKWGEYVGARIKDFTRLEMLFLPLMIALTLSKGGKLELGTFWETQKLFARINLWLMASEIAPFLKQVPFSLSLEQAERIWPAFAQWISKTKILSGLVEFALPSGFSNFGFSREDEIPVRYRMWSTFQTVETRGAIKAWFRVAAGGRQMMKTFDDLDKDGLFGEQTLRLSVKRDKAATTIPRRYLVLHIPLLFDILDRALIRVPGLSKWYEQTMSILRQPWYMSRPKKRTGIGLLFDYGIDVTTGDEPPRKLQWQGLLANLLEATPFFRSIDVYANSDEMGSREYTTRDPDSTKDQLATFPRPLLGSIQEWPRNQIVDAYGSLWNLCIQTVLWRDIILPMVFPRLTGGQPVWETDLSVFAREVWDATVGSRGLGWLIRKGDTTIGSKGVGPDMSNTNVIPEGQSINPGNFKSIDSLTRDSSVWLSIENTAKSAGYDPTEVVGYITRENSSFASKREIVIMLKNGTQEIIELIDYY